MSDTRKRILEAARDLYAAQGPDQLSMRRVAEEVGVSATAIYRHFEGKEQLIIEVCAEGFTLFASYLMRGLRGATPLERLTETGAGYVAFALDHPQYYRAMFMSPHPDFDALAEQTSQAFSPTFQLLVDRVAECQREGALRDDQSARALARSIWAHSHGLVSLWLDGHLDVAPGEDPLPALYATHQQNLLRGLMR